MFPPDIHDLARKVIETYATQKRKIATAESCTGGLVLAAPTQIPGSSAVVERGFMTYSDDAKIDGVDRLFVDDPFGNRLELRLAGPRMV